MTRRSPPLCRTARSKLSLVSATRSRWGIEARRAGHRSRVGQVDFVQDFFGREAFLTGSGQLNVEAYCLTLTKVYTFGPTFRAENSNTSRHLARFWMIEPQIAFADPADNAALAEALLKYNVAAFIDQ
jgi:asparaginyl-tRNA synthetase